MYEYKVRVGFSQCDVNCTLTITSLIDIFQDCSTFQSEDLGVGFRYLEKDNLVWLLNYWELDIIKLPKLCDTVVVGTAPYDFKGCFGHRNFWLKDEEGNYLVKANSLWTLVDRKEAKPVKANDELKAAYVLDEKLDMEYNARKVQILEGEDVEVIQREPIHIQLHHLDSNHHVNNGQYVKLATTSMNEEEMCVRRLRVDYRKQAMLGDVIYPVVYKQGDVLVTALNDADGKPYSVTEVRK